MTATARTQHDRMVAADLISIPEAARRVGLHRDTLYQLARSGRFPPGGVELGSHCGAAVAAGKGGSGPWRLTAD